MKFFANIDSENTVLNTIVVSDEDAPDEAAGIAFCKGLFGGEWLQTWEDGSRRKTFAGPGCVYSKVRDAFIPVKTFPSWVFDETKWTWKPPIDKPTDGKNYAWDEATTSWVEIVLPA